MSDVVDLSEYKVSEDTSQPVKPQDFNLLADITQYWLNNIESDMITSGTIALAQVEGVAIPASDISTAGAANKIAKTNSDGDITLADGGAIIASLS